MSYEYEEFIDAMRFGLTMSDRDSTDDIWKMVDEVVNKAKAFDEIKERFEKEYKAEVFEESLYHPENFDNGEFLVDVEHILYFEDTRYVVIEEDG